MSGPDSATLFQHVAVRPLAPPRPGRPSWAGAGPCVRQLRRTPDRVGWLLAPPPRPALGGPGLGTTPPLPIVRPDAEPAPVAGARATARRRRDDRRGCRPEAERGHDPGD